MMKNDFDIIRGEGDTRRRGAKLKEVMEVINETVGDALSDLFLVETVLLERGWSIQDWEKQYTDLPSRLAKVVVKVYLLYISCYYGGKKIFSFRITIKNCTPQSFMRH
jgi:hypothetical protein